MADQDFQDLNEFAKLIRKSPEKADLAFIEALDKGAEFARTRGIDQIFRELNLDRDYIAKNLAVTSKPKRGDLRSVIGSNPRPVLLPRYGGNKVATVAAKSPRRKLKGDQSRGIARGQKADGIKAFSVKRGGTPKRWGNAFLIRLKGSGAWGLATREGKGRNNYRIRYGPSVASAWRNVRNDIEADVYDQVAETFSKKFGRLF